MALFLTHPEPFQVTHKQRLAPGPEGGVGDVNMLPRLRTSCAALLPVRFDPKGLVQEPIRGSNVSDGQVKSYESKGGPARVNDTVWSSRIQRRCMGIQLQDLKAPSKAIEPIVVGSNQYSYRNAVATVVKASVTGNKFLPLPGEFTKSGLPRGGVTPRIIAVENPEEQQPPAYNGSVVMKNGNGGTDGLKLPDVPRPQKRKLSIMEEPVSKRSKSK